VDFSIQPRGQAQRGPTHVRKRKRIRRPSGGKHDPIARAVPGLDQPIVHSSNHRPSRAKWRSQSRVGKVGKLRGQIDAHVITGGEESRQHNNRPRQIGEDIGHGRATHIRERKLDPHATQLDPHRVGEFSGDKRTRRIASPVRDDHQTHRAPPAQETRPAP
jgi:hypothetical protein